MPSALIGQPPSDQEDYWIIKGMMHLDGIPDGALNPSYGFPLTLKPPPNYQYETRGPRLLIGLSFAIVLAVLITGTRLGLRLFRRNLRWGLDDWVIIPAMLSSLAWFSCCMVTVTYGGLGKHLYDTTYKEVYWLFRAGSVDQTLFWVTVGLVKISITLFNRRLTYLTSEKWMIAHNVFLVLLICWVVISLFLNVFQCTPALVQYDLMQWGHLHSPATCFDQNRLNIVLSVFHIIFDFTLLSVPILILIKVKMDMATKIRLGFLFSIGSVSCIGSVMRQFLAINNTLDSSWSIVTQVSWTIVDIFFAITAASLPVLNTLLPQKFLSSANSGFTYIHKPSGPTKVQGTKIENSGHSPDQTELNHYPSDDSSLDISHVRKQKDLPSGKYKEDWEDPAALVQHPQPTHRDKLHSRSVHEIQA